MSRPASIVIPTLAGLLTGAASVAGPGPVTVYSTDFEFGTPSGVWSLDAVAQSTGLSRFLGRLGNTSVTMSLALEAGQTHELSFDFYAIDSWDGSDTPWGPDTFGVRVDGQDIFRETFSGFSGPQTYEGDPTRSGAFGFGQWNDSVWRLTMHFAPTSNNTRIEFYAQGLEPMHNESWGLDNVAVRQMPAVPAPGGAALLGAIGAAGLRRRRR